MLLEGVGLNHLSSGRRDMQHHMQCCVGCISASTHRGHCILALPQDSPDLRQDLQAEAPGRSSRSPPEEELLHYYNLVIPTDDCSVYHHIYVLEGGSFFL